MRRSMKFRTLPVIIFISLVITAVAVTSIYVHSKRVQVISDPAKMQKCEDTGIFKELSGQKTKAWSFGVGDMESQGSVVCIYNGFGKPTISSIRYDRSDTNDKEAVVYVRTEKDSSSQHQIEIFVPGVFTVQVMDSESQDSYASYPLAYRDQTNGER